MNFSTNLNDLVKKAQMENLAAPNLHKEILKYVDDDALFEALEELNKRKAKNIRFEVDNYAINISTNPTLDGNYKITFLGKTYYYGAIIVTPTDKLVIPNNKDVFGNIDEEGEKRNRQIMLNCLRQLPSKDWLIRLVENQLEKLL